jgi:hypothetical protein
MEEANTLAHYDKTTITAVKSSTGPGCKCLKVFVFLFITDEVK